MDGSKICSSSLKKLQSSIPLASEIIDAMQKTFIDKFSSECGIEEKFNDFFKEENIKEWIINNLSDKFPEFGNALKDFVTYQTDVKWKLFIIFSIIALVVIVSLVLILHFTLGSKGNKADQNNLNGNNKNGSGTNTPGKNGSKTRQNDNESSWILKNSLVTGTGIAGGIGAKFAANKILGHGEQDGNNEKNEKNDKNQKGRDSNGPYNYVDSTEKVVTKAEGKDSGDNIEDANTAVSDTEQSETPNSTEGKGVSDNIENADTERPEIPNEAEKADETNEENGKN